MVNMLRQNPHLRLMDALGFSASDVAANSRGELSQEQKQDIQQARIAHIMRWVMLAALTWAIGLPLGLSWLILLFGTAVIVSMMIAGWQRADEDLNRGVMSVSGRLEVIPGPPLLLNYQVQVNQDSFTVSREAGAAFLPGHIYRLYATAGSRTLLSAELIS